MFWVSFCLFWRCKGMEFPKVIAYKKWNGFGQFVNFTSCTFFSRNVRKFGAFCHILSFKVSKGLATPDKRCSTFPSAILCRLKCDTSLPIHLLLTAIPHCRKCLSPLCHQGTLLFRLRTPQSHARLHGTFPESLISNHLLSVTDTLPYHPLCSTPIRSECLQGRIYPNMLFFLCPYVSAHHSSTLTLKAIVRASIRFLLP